MCGRFTITLTVGFTERFGVEETNLLLEPRYNIAPSQQVPVIISRLDGSREVVPMTWGLVPSWTRDLTGARPIINARAESLSERPSFRGPLARHRCLIPATGFYEWQRVGKVRTPHYIKRRDGGLFAFAGLYDILKGREPPMRSFTIITTEPNPLVAHYHDRMPAILRMADESRWLAPGSITPADIETLLSSYPEELLEAFQVSRAVNDPTHEGEELIRKVDGGNLPV